MSFLNAQQLVHNISKNEETGDIYCSFLELNGLISITWTTGLQTGHLIQGRNN